VPHGLVRSQLSLLPFVCRRLPLLVFEAASGFWQVQLHFSAVYLLQNGRHGHHSAGHLLSRMFSFFQIEGPLAQEGVLVAHEHLGAGEDVDDAAAGPGLELRGLLSLGDDGVHSSVVFEAEVRPCELRPPQCRLHFGGFWP
jgi:hypothetical protein